MMELKKKPTASRKGSYKNVRAMMRGLRIVARHWWSLLAAFAVIALLAFCASAGGRWLVAQLERYTLTAMLSPLAYASVTLLAITVAVGCLCAVGTPRSAGKVERWLAQSSIADSQGETPKLVSVAREANGGLAVYEFDSPGVALEKWEKGRATLETLLNRRVVRIEKGNDERTIRLFTAMGGAMPDVMPWADELADAERLVLGQSDEGRVEIDLSATPHLLIGGSSGSGKTQLMRLIVHQLEKQGAKIYLIDFKGGFDWPEWRGAPRFASDMDGALRALRKAVEEMENRKEHAATFPSDTPALEELTRERIVVVFDEVAEALDTTGLGKEEKSRVADAVRMLSAIGRLGRAFHVNLVLGTQRPDADVVPGQIKNNCDVRICGRADTVLSRIVLDNTTATRIPKDARGRFILGNGGDGLEFQAYYLA